MSEMDTAERGDLREALREHIFRVYAGTPVAERRASRWVMDPEWISDVRMLDRGPGTLWPVPPVPIGQPECILGLPLEIRTGTGPPHLER